MSAAVAEATSAAQVRRALVRELRAERAEVAAIDLDTLATAIGKVVARGLKAASKQSTLTVADRNGVTQLEVAILHAVTELMLRAYWPHVAAMYAAGSGRKPVVINNLDALEYDELLDVYDSVHARLAREAVTNAAWRIATSTLMAARRLPRAS